MFTDLYFLKLFIYVTIKSLKILVLNKLCNQSVLKNKIIDTLKDLKILFEIDA